MLNLAAAKIWLCIEPTDMRKSFGRATKTTEPGIVPNLAENCITIHKNLVATLIIGV